jgi:hypothetical protein
LSIPPGATRYLDVGCWLQTTPLGLTLQVVPPPGSNRHILNPGGWRFRLAVTIRNGDATFWDAEISFRESVTAGVAAPVDVTAKVEQVELVMPLYSPC